MYFNIQQKESCKFSKKTFICIIQIQKLLIIYYTNQF